MGRFISNFQTTAELLSFSGTTGFGTPHVSMTKDTSEIYYFEKIESQYRWVDDGYTCVGYDKYTKKKQQISNDSGETWTDTGVISAVTLVEENSEYCGYVPPTPAETRVVATFNVTSTTSPTQIGYYNDISGFSAIEIDGVEQPSVVSAYTFSTTGEHTVKYTLTDSTSVVKNAFWGCDSLAAIEIPDSVTTIGEWAFQDCTSLTSIDIPDSVTSIDNYAFKNCSGMTTCTIGSGVTSIGDYAFAYCSGLTNIVIPDSVTSIGDYAFEYCSGLTSCTIGSGITSIEEYAFYECRSLTSITVNAVTPPSIGYEIVDGTCGKGSGSGSGSEPPAIYVPSGNVDTYKAASGWSDYKCAIHPIQ